MLYTLEREQALAGSDPSRISFFANHPATPERVKDTTAAARTLTRGAAQPIAATRAAFLARLDGVIVGPDPANGIFIDNVFQQPALAVALEMPPGWKMKNTPAAAVASEPEGRAVVTLQIAGEGRDPAEGARQDGLDERLVERLTRRTIAGLPAAQLIAQDRDVRLHLTWIAYQNHVFRVAGVSSIRGFKTYRGKIFGADRIELPSPLRPVERDRIMEARLRPRPLHTAKTLRSLSPAPAASGRSNRPAVANGVTVDARLPEGFAVKVPIRQRYTPRPPVN